MANARTTTDSLKKQEEIIKLGECDFGDLGREVRVGMLISALDSYNLETDEFVELLSWVTSNLGEDSVARMFTRKLWSEYGKKGAAMQTDEDRRKALIRANASLSKEDRQRISSAGGRAAAEKMTAEERSERARNAARARYKK